jgi:hypothetical protein
MYFDVVTNKNRSNVSDAVLARHMDLSVAKDFLRRSAPQHAVSFLRRRRGAKLALVLSTIEIHRTGYQRA